MEFEGVADLVYIPFQGYFFMLFERMNYTIVGRLVELYLDALKMVVSPSQKGGSPLEFIRLHAGWNSSAKR